MKPWHTPGKFLSYSSGRGLAVCVDPQDSYLDSEQLNRTDVADYTFVAVVEDTTVSPFKVGALYWMPDSLIDAPDGNYPPEPKQRPKREDDIPF